LVHIDTNTSKGFSARVSKGCTRVVCRPYNLYCVDGDVKPCSINHSVCSVKLRERYVTCAIIMT